MTNIKFQIVDPDDNKSMALIAGWYLNEWNIPADKTMHKLRDFSASGLQFHVIMTLNNIPVATGGLHNHVSLLDKEPKFGAYKNWLALVYTTPEHRGKGYGALICKHIQNIAQESGLKEILLFTYTAENLYKRLGWLPLERLTSGDKNIVVMKKIL